MARVMSIICAGCSSLPDYGQNTIKIIDYIFTAEKSEFCRREDLLKHWK